MVPEVMPGIGILVQRGEEAVRNQKMAKPPPGAKRGYTDSGRLVLKENNSGFDVLGVGSGSQTCSATSFLYCLNHNDGYMMGLCCKSFLL